MLMRRAAALGWRRSVGRYVHGAKGLPRRCERWMHLPRCVATPFRPVASLPRFLEVKRGFANLTDADVEMTTPDNAVVYWPRDEMHIVTRHVNQLPRNFELRALAIDAGLHPEQWGLATASFRQAFLHEPELFFQDQDEVRHFVQECMEQQRARRGLFLLYPHFLLFARARDYIPMPENGEVVRSLQQLTDLRLPHEWFPLALMMRRKIVCHVGPTNSGKTHAALQRLREAGEHGGIYCGPLRLLALEVYERMNMDGVYTSLLTGQEKKEVPCATHVSCTIEMANLAREWDVAVLDEIQMFGDPQRGWAWTKAFFGLQASEIHVCGSPDALPLLQKFVAVTGDDLQVETYERRSPLTVADAPLLSYRNVRPGDCVVAFSRREIFQIKRRIEIETGQKCCIIYGQLPPETRTQQARLFNAQDNDYNVLVASDAIGMGLNLNIRRVVFSSVRKYSGVDGGQIDISPALVKQIAGRAGRSGGAYEAGGEVTTLTKADLDFLQGAMASRAQDIQSAGLFPSSEQMEAFAKQLPGITDLGDLLDKYVALARLDGDYFMCNHVDMKEAAGLLRDVALSLRDRFTFCMAPVNLRTPLARRVFTDYARAHARQDVVPLDIFLPHYAPRTADALRDVEIKAQILDLYLWLSFHFPTTFTEQARALEMKTQALALVEQGLRNTTYQGKPLPRTLTKPRDQSLTGRNRSRFLRDDSELTKTTASTSTSRQKRSGRPWRRASTSDGTWQADKEHARDDHGGTSSSHAGPGRRRTLREELEEPAVHHREPQVAS